MVHTLTFRFAASRVPARRVHAGAVASGDLEILLDLPARAGVAEVRVRTPAPGRDDAWRAVLDAFFGLSDMSGRWEINDGGASPAILAERLQQVAAAAADIPAGDTETCTETGIERSSPVHAYWQCRAPLSSFLDYDARTRAEVLLDPGSMRVLCGPFDRLESPWLAPQGIVPQADDGVVVAKGAVDARPVVVISIEQRFRGGGLGEVSGAKASEALALAAAESRAGRPIGALLLLETGGVRLQEANLGLNAVAELCSALLDLRPFAPVIGLVAGRMGSFGGVSIAAGLCTRLIVTPESRIGLNGPVVIEQEAGAAELDSSDEALIWAIDGGEQRHAVGLADALVRDDVFLLRQAVREALARSTLSPGCHRSERIDVLASRVATLSTADPPAPSWLRAWWGSAYEPVRAARPAKPRADVSVAPVGRGFTWLRALAGDAEPVPVIPSVFRADLPGAVYLAVVPDPENRFHRARHGELGLTECLALAETIRTVVRQDEGSRHRRAIVAVVDLPGQAYGRVEEMTGLYQTIAAAVDAYHAARAAGHPVVALVVGTALSGGFLGHGLQANRILALDDPGVSVQAMRPAAVARLTNRSIESLDQFAESIVPLSPRIEDWASLGICDGLLPVSDADEPGPSDVEHVKAAVEAAVAQARGEPPSLSRRLDGQCAIRTRKASRMVRDKLAEQWSVSEDGAVPPEFAL